MAEAHTSLVDKYQAEAAANPESVDAQCNLGWGYYGDHRYSDAIDAFRVALRLDSGSVDANYGLALSLKEAGLGEEAVPVFEKVAVLAPQKETGPRGRMLARLARGHISQIQTGEWNIDMDTRRDESEETYFKPF
jgi:cytochrome c-type biogenesis protein CcmH/NrfG